MTSLSVLILTYNEAKHIERAISSVAAIASEIVIVDSGSTDGTPDLAARTGARILYHPFVNYARSFQWGLDNGELTGDWIMRLDADEVIEPDLAREIAEQLPRLEPGVNGVVLKRRHIFMGRPIRYGGRYPTNLLRIWKNGAGRIEDRWMDEHIVLMSGDTVTFRNPFSDANLNDLSFFTDKHNRYATREAIDALNQRYGLFKQDVGLHARSGSEQATFKRRVKEQVYNRIPFGLAALTYVLYRYFIQLGFLDGVEGLIYHVLQGGWYRFLVGAKVVELDRHLSSLPTREARLEALGRLTGYGLPSER